MSVCRFLTRFKNQAKAQELTRKVSMHWPGIQLTAAIVGYIGMIKLSFYPARSFIDLHGGPRWTALASTKQ